MEQVLLVSSTSRIMLSSSSSSMALFLLCSLFLCYLYYILWLKPERIREKLRRQGITGPPPSFLYGNVLQMKNIQSMATKHHLPAPALLLEDHDYASILFPYFHHWTKLYGSIFMYSTGNRQHLYTNNPEMVKEMNLCTSLDLGKPSYVSKTLAPMLGNGILRSNGQVWAQQKKIIAPELFIDKAKGMVGLMVESTLPMLQKWEKLIEGGEGGIADIRIDEDLRSVSADVISRTCFGSSYSKGKGIFSMLRTLQTKISKQGFLFGLPSITRLVPSKNNREIWKLEREIESLILELVKERQTTSDSDHNKDLLQLITEGAKCNQLGKSFIVDNCKNIYFAGHESTATATIWCLMLLALHPQWQARVRAELLQVSGDHIPNAEALSKMKTLTMVIQETLRLYNPAAFVSREALEEVKIGDVLVPKGTCIWTLIPALHRDPDIWGPEANKFKPERFANGVSEACKFPQAYVPFGVGPRLCLGRNFAMLQLKAVLSLILSNFIFSISPNYQHSPTFRMMIEPANGVHLLVQKIFETRKLN